MDGIEQALRGVGDAELGAAAGLLDEVRRRLFGFAPPEIRLGPYRVLQRVGEGGGGVVVRAEDPRLHRPVAIKLVHPTARTDDDAARRLLREARVLARLSHPDIVTIYDVGRIDARRDAALAHIVGAPVHGTVFLVMQWCEGGDLSRWLASAPRRWPEILDAFTAAGRGLAAAHAAGVLHRDFKPANVLLDRDGRPRIGDFGLGRAEAPPTRDDRCAPLDGTTGGGGLVGTPLYMAPEQHLGEALDARSDQYAFCFALHEALYGERAFASADALVKAKLAGPPAVDASVVPAAIGRAIARGLAPDVRERWPSMQALLDALEHARRPRLRARTFALLAVPALLVAAAGIETRPTALCEADDTTWTAVWGEPRAEIADVFDTRAHGFGRDTFAALDERMSALGREWSAARDHVCTTRSQPALACLAGQRERARELVAAWRDIDRDGIARAAFELERLDDPRRCLSASPETETGTLAPEIARIDALVAAGRVAEAAALADTVSPSDDPRARIIVASALDRVGRYADAERELVTAVHAAESTDDRRTVVRASMRLVSLIGAHAGRHDDAAWWARHAWAALDSTDDDGSLAADLHEHLGMLALARGQWQRALEHFEETLRLGAVVFPDDQLHRAANLANAAAAMMKLGRFTDAIDRLEEAVEVQRAKLGEGHPSLAMTRHNLAAAFGSIGDIPRAREEATRALDAWTVAYGELHPDVALALQTLGSACAAAGELDRAIELHERARAVRIQLLGADHPVTHDGELSLAHAYSTAGDLAKARALLEHLVTVWGQDPAPASNEGIALMNLGNVQLRLGEHDAAERNLEHAHELLLTTHGARHPAISLVLQDLEAVRRDRAEDTG